MLYYIITKDRGRKERLSKEDTKPARFVVFDLFMDVAKLEILAGRKQDKQADFKPFL